MGLVGFSGTLWAQESIYQQPVIHVQDADASLDSVPGKKSESGSSSLGAALEEVPSLQVVRAGMDRSQQSFFLRGIPSHQILVLFEGIPLTNPMGVSRESAFGELNAEDLESIAVHAGPQVARLGPQALGGALELGFIPSNHPVGLRSSMKASAGSYGSFQQSGKLDFWNGKTFLRGWMSHRSLRGFSSAGAAWGNTEPDGSEGWQGMLLAKSQSPGQWKGYGLVSLQDSESDLDQGGGPGQDDPNFTGRTQQRLLGLGGAYFWTPRIFSTEVQVMQSRFRRELRDLEDSSHLGQSLDAEFIGIQNQLTIQNRWRTQTAEFQGGYQLEFEQGRTATRSSYPGFADSTSQFAEQAPIHQGNLGVNIAWLAEWRTEAQARLLSHRSYDVAWAYQMENTVGPGSGEVQVFHQMARGVRFPSLYQRYSTYGNSSLLPEVLNHQGLGIRQASGGAKIQSQVTLFRDRYERGIDYRYDLNRYDAFQATIWGVETQLHWQFASAWKWKTHYTWLHTRDDRTAEALLRRPTHSVVAGIEWKGIQQKLRSELSWRLLSARSDRSLFGKEVLPVSQSWNFSVGYQVAQGWDLWGRIDNLLDQPRVDIWGYGDPGRTLELGVQAQF